MMPVEYPCPDGMVCRNVEGEYYCDCPPGTSQDVNSTDVCVCKSLTVGDGEAINRGVGSKI